MEVLPLIVPDHAVDVFRMYCILLGGELNMMMYDKMFTERQEKL